MANRKPAGVTASLGRSRLIRRALPLKVLIAVSLAATIPAGASAQEDAATVPADGQTTAAPRHVAPVPAPAEAAQSESTAAAPPRARSAESRAAGAGRAHVGGTLDERVAYYARQLNLDVYQEAQLRKLLVEQRDQVQRLWADTTTPPAQRIQATKAIEDATSDRIRSMLNEEQRKKYNPPRPPRDKLIQAQSTSVEDWMALTSAHQSN
jgi:hypothetical protein